MPSTEIQVMSVKNTARKTHTFTHHIILFKPRKRKKKATSRFADLEKFAVCNPCQSSPSFTILVPLWFKIMSLVFFYLSKILFSGFLKFTGNFVRGQSNFYSGFQNISHQQEFSSKAPPPRGLRDEGSYENYHQGKRYPCITKMLNLLKSQSYRPP